MSNHLPYFYSPLYVNETLGAYWFDIGCIASDFGRHDIAIESFEKSLSHKKDNILVIYSMAREYAIKRKWKECITSISGILHIEKRNSVSGFNIDGNNYYNINDNTGIDINEPNFCGLINDNTDAMVERDSEYNFYNEPNNKLVEGSEYSAQYSYFIDVILGHVYLGRGNLVQAHAHFSEALLISTKDEFLKYGVASWNEMAGRVHISTSQFVNMYKTIRNRNIRHEIEFRVACIANANREGRPRLFDGFTRGMLKLPSTNFIIVQKALYFDILGDYDSALHVLSGVLNKDRSFVLAHRLQIDILFRTGDFEKIISEYERKINSLKDQYVNYIFARALLATNQVNKAFDILRKILDSTAKDCSIWNTFGIVYCRVDQLKDAIDCFKTAMKFRGVYLQPIINHALVLKQLGKEDEANEMYNSIKIELNLGEHNLRNFKWETTTDFLEIDERVSNTIYFAPHLFLNSNFVVFTNDEEIAALNPLFFGN